ncbi:mechanosensitive ion channel family protein [Pedobacter sp.]|nr:mechanosensitive ion channel family protein [Candidatus Saccharibacteria bacterium]
MEALFTWLEPRWFPVLVILAVVWLGRHFGGVVIDRLVRRAIRSTKFNDLSTDDIKKRQDTLISLFRVIWQVILTVVASFMLFEILFPQINLAPIFASAGIIGVAIGFGAQSLIKDFLTGIFIITENQYRVGDVVDLQGATGTVERITIRSTVLRDADGSVHYIPNGSIIHVVNKTMGFSKVNFTLAVNPETNVEELSEVINNVGNKLAKDEAWKDKILLAPQFVGISTFSDVKLEVTIVGTTQPSDQWSVTGELRRRLLRAFKRHNIELA